MLPLLTMLLLVSTESPSCMTPVPSPPVPGTPKGVDALIGEILTSCWRPTPLLPVPAGALMLGEPAPLLLLFPPLAELLPPPTPPPLLLRSKPLTGGEEQEGMFAVGDTGNGRGGSATAFADAAAIAAAIAAVAAAGSGDVTGVAASARSPKS